jgi:hypothetical protein
MIECLKRHGTREHWQSSQDSTGAHQILCTQRRYPRSVDDGEAGLRRPCIHSSLSTKIALYREVVKSGLQRVYGTGEVYKDWLDFLHSLGGVKKPFVTAGLVLDS